MRQLPCHIRSVTGAILLTAALISGCAAGNTPPESAAPTTAQTATLSPSPTAPASATPAPSATAQASPTAAEPPTAEPTTAEQANTALPVPPEAFDGARAYEDVEYQVSLGPRTPGSDAHAQLVQWMQDELAKNGWTVEVQEFTSLGHQGRNIIAKRGSGRPWTILGAHFDARMRADNDPDPNLHGEPVPGANDGASGVGVLMELARVLPDDMAGEVWLAFFDLEDQGNLEGWDWILGSRALAESLSGKPDAVVIVDMIGDADLNIFQEKNSTRELTEEIWATAAQLGYEQYFIPQERWAMLDDHTPFLEKNIDAADLIDFDYPYWHTTQDTADKVSAQSLQVVGDTVLHWILSRHAQ